jgi:hypothetical protein
MADVKPLAVPGEIEEVLVLRMSQREQAESGGTLPAPAPEAPAAPTVGMKPAPTAAAPPELPAARTEAR